MLSGRYDHYFPLETSTIPLFELFGTLEEDKRLIVYESGHVLPWNTFVKDVLDWLDERIGPVDYRRERRAGWR